MTAKPQTLDELMAEEDAKRLAQARADIRAMQDEWNAMTPEQQAAALREREARMDAAEGDSPTDEDDEDDAPTDEDDEDDEA